MSEPDQTDRTRRAFTEEECITILGGAVSRLLRTASTESVVAALAWAIANCEEWPASPFDRAATMHMRAPTTRM